MAAIEYVECPECGETVSALYEDGLYGEERCDACQDAEGLPVVLSLLVFDGLRALA